MNDVMTRRAALGAAGGTGLALAAAAFLPSRAAADKDEERHPHIRRAIEELREAKKDLENADHDFGGHRKEASEAIDVALKQLRICLENDKK
jgi:hypothetical protein